MLNIAAHLRIASGEDSPVDEEDCVLAPVSEEGERKLNEDVLDAWQLEAASVDRFSAHPPWCAQDDRLHPRGAVRGRHFWREDIWSVLSSIFAFFF